MARIPAYRITEAQWLTIIGAGTQVPNALYFVEINTWLVRLYETDNAGTPNPRIIGGNAHKGPYAGGTTYLFGDLVESNGSSWFCKVASSTGNAPPTFPTTSNSYWTLIAQKGTDGLGVGGYGLPAGGDEGDVPVRGAGPDGTVAWGKKASLVGGKLVDSEFPAGFGRVATTYNGNLDALENNYIAYCLAAANRPGAKNGYIQVWSFSSEYTLQIYTEYDYPTGDIYIRTQQAGVWGAWNRSFGTEAEIAEKFLSLTGGSLTGNLTLAAASDPELRLAEGGSTTSYGRMKNASPTQSLIEHVSASGAALIDINPKANDGASSAYFRFFRETNTTGLKYIAIYIGDGSATLQHQLGAAGVDSYLCVNNGNLAIGHSSVPTAKLHTTGTVRMANFGAGTATFDASGNVSSSSDERLKEGIEPFEGGLSEIRQIEPITYNWNAMSGMDRLNRYSGFSAQNVQAAMPEAVGMDGNGFLTVQDRPIVAALLNAVKELAQRVEQLEAERA